MKIETVHCDHIPLSLERRLLLMAQMLFAVAPTAAEASPINPSETFALQPGQIQFKPSQGLPSASGEMAMLYSDSTRAVRTL
jgi:hypothetical protein